MGEPKKGEDLINALLFSILAQSGAKKYTDQQIEAIKALGPFTYEGDVATYADLPILTTSDKGKVYGVEEDGSEQLWTGSAWRDFGADLTLILQDIEDLKRDKYELPEGGIPKDDLDSEVQSSLNKAETALQEHQSLSAYRTSAQQDEIDNAQNDAIAAKYAKPISGIPKTDLASGVQESLGRADTALQAHQSLAAYRTAEEQDDIDDGKQDTISDLENIRSGASSGATAYQKPIGGVPKSDLSQSVQNTLDNSIQKVSNPTAGNVAILDASGNVADSGKKYAPDVKTVDMTLKVGIDENGKLWAENESGYPKFGVSGIGQSSNNLTRLWDSSGMTASPGTDATQARSDFDSFAPFNRRKCVGTWNKVNGKAVFTVNAYYGDPDYAEDGTMGDFVAYDVGPVYWYHSGNIIGVSAGPHPGWTPHEVCLDKNKNVREHTYLPAYELAQDGSGHAVSLPGYHPVFGDYASVWNKARTYHNGDMADCVVLEPSVVDHYNWLLMTIEFATQNMQNVMAGATAMRYTSDVISSSGTNVNSIVVTSAVGGNYVVGQSIYIGSSYSATPSNVDAYNVITSIENCDADGTPNPSGTYRLITFSGPPRTVTGGTTQLGSRPWITGSTNTVLGHTGSPVSNTDQKHPCVYRWLENPYGSINKTCGDLMDVRVADGSSYKLRWYYNDNMRHDGSATVSNPGSEADLSEAKGWHLLSVETPTESYKDGYIKERKADEDYPCILVPTLTTGGSATTYYCDYAALVNSYVVRAVRRRGILHYGAYYGPCCVYADLAPSYSAWHYGGGLFITQ